MISFIAHILITSAFLLIVAHLVKGIKVDGWGSAILGALILGLANAFIRPILVFFSFPLIALTFGLFVLIVNAVVLQLVAALTPGVKVDGCGSAIIGSLVLSLLNLAIGLVLGDIALN